MPPKIDTYRYIIYVLAVLQADSLTLKTFCERMILVEKDILSDGKKTTVMTLDKATENLLQFSIRFLKNLKFTLLWRFDRRKNNHFVHWNYNDESLFWGGFLCECNEWK